MINSPTIDPGGPAELDALRAENAALLKRVLEAEGALKARDGEPADGILQRYRLLSEHSRDVLLFFRMDGSILEGNQAAVNTYGYPLAELVGKSLRDIRVEETWACISDQMQQVQQGPIRFETIHRRKDGTRLPVEVSWSFSEIGGEGVVLSIIRDLSGRSEAEERLRESELFYRQTLESIPGMSFTTRPDGFCDYQSSQWVEFTGVPASEHLGTGWNRLLHPDDQERAAAAWLAAVEDRAPYEIEYRVRRYDGVYEWFRARGRPIRDAQGKIVRWFGVVVNIHQQKQAEEALKASEQRLAMALQAGQLGFWDWDIPSGRVLFGGRWAAMLGYELHEIDPDVKSWANLVHPDEAEWVNRILGDHLEGRTEFYECEHRLRHKDGTWRWILDRGQVVQRDADGRPLRALGTHADITERKRAEEELRASEERYRATFNNAAVGIAHVGLDGRWLRFNDAVCSITGHSPEALLQKTFADITHPDDVERDWAQARRLLSGEIATYTMEKRYLRRDGQVVWARLTASLLRGSDGQVRNFIAVLEDISEQKSAEVALDRAQAQLREYTERLEQTVAERTARLLETNEQLETFVYSIAHDLRAPLRAITAYAQLLNEDYSVEIDEDGKSMLMRIQASSEFMDRLLLDLLAYGRTARDEVELGPVEVSKAWAAALFQCAGEIEQSGAVVDTMEPLPAVLAHEATLGQALTNLLSNALRFIKLGERPRIRLWAEESGPSIRLWVEDNGIGIPPDQTERIFRIFERSHGSRYPGTGIGLSIVRKGIERMGGRVGVESEPGSGARFWIELAKPEPCGT
jgi:PAS domain S-box-containing protein